MRLERRRELFVAVERATELPMLVLAVAFAGILLVPANWTESAATEGVLEAISWTIWAAFAAELVTKTYLAENRIRYLVRHWFDVLALREVVWAFPGHLMAAVACR